MTTHLFTRDGTSIDKLAVETKATAKADGIQLKAARDVAAVKRGYSSWQDMVENAVEMEEDHLPDCVVTRRMGQDKITLDLDVLTGLDAYDPDTELLRGLFVERKILVRGEGIIEHSIVFMDEKPQYGHYSEFTPKEPFIFDDFLELTEADETPENMSRFIGMLQSAGFFEGLLDIPLDSAEHEAMLELMMRKKGRSVRDRVVFNTGMTKVEVIDFEKRCFANQLDNGDIVVSNGIEYAGKLNWKVLPRDAFDALVREMKAAHGPDAAVNGHGEIWMHDRTLLDGVEATTVSEPYLMT